MGDEHLDTVPVIESDKVIKSSVEDLVPIPSESEGIPDKMCDVPLYENTTPLNALNKHSEIVVNSDDDNSSSDDDSPYGEDIDYVDASPPDIDPDPGDLTSIDPGIRKNVSTTNVNVPLEDDQSSLFAYVVWIFLAFLTYPVVPPYLLSTGNEDTIFDPGISIYHSFMPDVSHRSGTFMKFNVYPNRLNGSSMMTLSSTSFPLDCPDYEDSRALSFAFHPQEFHILSFILGIQTDIQGHDQKESHNQQNKHEMERTKSKGQRKNPPNLANLMRPPDFNQSNVQNNQGNQSRYQGNNFNSNQNSGGNFNQNLQNNQGAVFQTPPYQPPMNQPPVYQDTTQQIQGVSKTDFENYVKANDAVLKNVQNQGQNLQNQMANVTSLLTNLCNNSSLRLYFELGNLF
ncbi:hypothetical protein Tco_0575540 [Tanacetum coccineum]